MQTWHDGLPARQPVPLPLPQRPGMRPAKAGGDDSLGLKRLDGARYWLDDPEQQDLPR